MLTLQEFGTEIVKIREAVNELTIKGPENASLVVYVNKKCNELVQAINEAVQELRNPPEDHNGGKTDDEPIREEGEVNGKQDSGTTS